MSEHTYQVVEVVGTSVAGVDTAIKNAIAQSGTDAANLDWFEVVDIRGHIEDGAIAHTQVTLKLGSRLS
jgi:dodecin